MFCFSNDDPKETCPLAFIYLYIYFYYFLMRQNLKEQFAGILSNAQQKNIPAKEVYLTLNNDCIFPNELSEVIWLRAKLMPEFEPRPHWWKAIALTTAPPLLPL